MSGPWEDFQPQAAAEAGPWTQFAAAPPARAPAYGDIDKMVGAAEGAGSVLSGVVAGPLAGLAGMGAITKNALSNTAIGSAIAKALGITDTDPAEIVRMVQEALTYQPASETGKKVAGAIGYLPEKLAEGANVVGEKVSDAVTANEKSINDIAGEKIGGAAGPALGAAANTLTQAAVPIAAGKGIGAAGGGIAARVRAARETRMAGAGAAETDVATQRIGRAEALPVPLELTKGQATRDFEQQRFERETAKDGKTGEPLRQRFAQQNEEILQNFDTWVDQTGASAPDLRAVGQGVDQALVAKTKAAKAQIKAKYQEAKAAGETSALVPTDEIVSFLEENRPAAVNAPVLTSVEQKLLQLKGAVKDDTGTLTPRAISLNDMEELRKFVGRVSGTTDTNIKFGGDVKRVIDETTEGRGGELYRQARKLRTQYGIEFDDRAVINRLLSKKPGTADRSVAFEDVFKHAILDGSLDDVRHVRRVLQTGDVAGQQAWKELQGATVSYIKEQATKNAARDVRGNEIVSAAGLDKAIVNLDRDGKLDFVFGKQGAQQLRDINDLAKDVFTSPPGAINASGTSAVLLEALSNFMVGKIPTGAAKAIGAAKKALQNRKTTRRINESLDYAKRRDELLQSLEENQ